MLFIILFIHNCRVPIYCAKGNKDKVPILSLFLLVTFENFRVPNKYVLCAAWHSRPESEQHCGAWRSFGSSFVGDCLNTNKIPVVRLWIKLYSFRIINMDKWCTFKICNGRFEKKDEVWGNVSCNIFLGVLNCNTVLDIQFIR